MPAAQAPLSRAVPLEDLRKGSASRDRRQSGTSNVCMVTAKRQKTLSWALLVTERSTCYRQGSLIRVSVVGKPAGSGNGGCWRKKEWYERTDFHAGGDAARVGGASKTIRFRWRDAKSALSKQSYQMEMHDRPLCPGSSSMRRRALPLTLSAPRCCLIHLLVQK